MAASLDAIRRNTHTGRPLGERDFVTSLEKLLHRRLAPRKGGRPPKPAANENQMTFSSYESWSCPRSHPPGGQRELRMAPPGLLASEWLREFRLPLPPESPVAFPARRIRRPNAQAGNCDPR